MSEISDITILIGTITTSIGTLFGIGLSVYTVTRKEAQNFKIRINEHQKVVNPLPGYDKKKLYTNLRVVNTGGRPLQISTAGYAFLNSEGGGIFSDSLRFSGNTIDVDKVQDYLADETDRPNIQISYYYATSLTGKTRKKYVIPRVIVWTRNLLSIMRVWRKSTVEPQN